jgi:hypothetical protein
MAPQQVTVSILSDAKASDKQKEEAITTLVAQYKKEKNAAGLADLVKKASFSPSNKHLGIHAILIIP